MPRGYGSQVWSNPQAVEDYQNLLNGIVPTVYGDRASCFVMGTGPASSEEALLGKWLMSINPRGDDVAVDALGELPATMIFDDPDGADQELDSFPIYMCVGADELEDAIGAWLGSMLLRLPTNRFHRLPPSFDVDHSSKFIP